MSNSPTVLTGSIERITFYSDETGYTVARFVAEPTAEYAGREPLTKGHCEHR